MMMSRDAVRVTIDKWKNPRAPRPAPPAGKRLKYRVSRARSSGRCRKRRARLVVRRDGAALRPWRVTERRVRVTVRGSGGQAQAYLSVDRRIADAGLGAALISYVQCDGARGGGIAPQRQCDFQQILRVYLDSAEVLVFLYFARGEFRPAQHYAIVPQAESQLVTVKVIALCDLPGYQQAGCIPCRDVQSERLVRR